MSDRREPSRTPSRPHVLYIAFFYPPSRSSGVYRAHALVQSFVRKGWDVTVVTTDDEFFDRATGSSDWSLVDEVPPCVDIVRVPFDLPTTKRVDVRALGWFEGNFRWLSLQWRRLLRRPLKLLDVLAGRDPLAFDFQDRYTGWIDPVVRAGRRVDASRPVDAIVATGNPFSSFEAARLLARLLDRPFGIDYRDPWALDVRTGQPLERTRGTREAEGRIIDESDFVVYVNEATIEPYADLYPQVAAKAEVFFNGYDMDSLSQRVEEPAGDLRFGMLGTATDLWPLEEFFDAWRSERRDLGPGSTIHLAGYLGYFSWSASPLEDLFPSAAEGFLYHGPVAKTAVGQFYDSIDVIVVLLFGGPILTAGKMYETMAQGKPILCVQPSDGGARKVFESHPLAVCVDSNPRAIAEGLHEVARIARATTVEDRHRIRADMARYERLRELDRFVDRVAVMAGRDDD